MARAIKVLFFFFILSIIFSQTSFAASSTFFSQAKKYYDMVCKAKVVAGPVALDCYVFDKVGEIDAALSILTSKITSLELANTSQDEKIEDLETKITSLEERIEELEEDDLTPKTITFASNRPQPFDSEWIDVQGGYTTMTVSLSITGFITDYAIHYSNDPNVPGYTFQQGVSCGSSITCPITTVPIIGKYYRISTGTASGNVTSTAVLNP